MAQNPRTSELQTSLCAKTHLEGKYRGTGQVQETKNLALSSGGPGCIHYCPSPGTRGKPRQVLHLLSWREAGKALSRMTEQVYFQPFPPRFYIEKKSFCTQIPGRSQAATHPPQTVQTGHYRSWWQDTGRRAAQSVVDLRYQNRARKSSLHVMKPGLVGECTMQRTMLLWPRDSRFLRSAVLESQQQRLMVLSSGSKI